MTTPPPDPPEINNDRLYWVFEQGETLAYKGPFRDAERARALARYVGGEVLGIDVTYLAAPVGDSS